MMKFCWTTLRVSDFDKSLRFYRDLIGRRTVRKLNCFMRRTPRSRDRGTEFPLASR